MTTTRTERCAPNSSTDHIAAEFDTMVVEIAANNLTVELGDNLAATTWPSEFASCWLG